MTATTRHDARARVAVVGGGFTGALFALQLARKTTAPVAILIIEPRAVLGAGVAYSTADPSHRINVPASRMSIFGDDPAHFERWFRDSGAIESDPDAVWKDGTVFPRRADFGRYVAEMVARESHSRSDVTVDHVEALATAITRTGHGYIVELSRGGKIAADIVVLAVSHPPPSLPALVAEHLADDPALIADPWQPNALQRIGSGDDVLIIGTGLTMADIVASLGRSGHAGKITAFSRHGLLSRGHAASSVPFDRFKDFVPPKTALELSRAVRDVTARAVREGIPWQAVLDDVRANGQRLWGALGEPEKRRLLRHLRAYWDVHRYRVAPQVEAELHRRREAGSFRVLAASLRSARRRQDKIEIVLHPRRSPPDTAERISVDTVIVTTGPAHGSVVERNQALFALARQGRLRPDALGLGIEVNGLSQAIGTDGKADGTLLVVGPLARGTFGELMGLPQIAGQSTDVASQVAAWLALRRNEKSSSDFPTDSLPAKLLQKQQTNIRI